MLSNVQQTSIAPLIQATIVPGSRSIPMVRHLHPLYQSGAMSINGVSWSRQYARDEDGDGFW